MKTQQKIEILISYHEELSQYVKAYQIEDNALAQAELKKCLFFSYGQKTDADPLLDHLRHSFKIQFAQSQIEYNVLAYLNDKSLDSKKQNLKVSQFFKQEFQELIFAKEFLEFKKAQLEKDKLDKSVPNTKKIKKLKL